MATITKDMLIGDILDQDPEAAEFFFAMGMYCVGCPASRGETLEQACLVHAIDPDEMVQELNARLTSVPQKAEK